MGDIVVVGGDDECEHPHDGDDENDIDNYHDYCVS